MTACCAIADMLKLKAWLVMPGWCALAEMLFRSSHFVGSPGDKSHFAFIAGRSVHLLKLSDCTNTKLLKKHLSLAATARKLLWPCMQHYHSTGHGPLAEQQAGLKHEQQQQWFADQQTTQAHSRPAGLVNYLFTSVLDLEGLMIAVCPLGSTSDAGGGTSDGASCADQVFPHNHGLKLGKQHEAQSLNVGAVKAVKPPHTEQAFLIFKLLSVTLVTLVQVCFWMKSCDSLGSGLSESDPGWLEFIIEKCGLLHNTCLRDTASSLLSGASLSQPGFCVEISLAWERFAVGHLHGRLLPGCCNLTCTSLSGVCEEGLSTMLCSGCRRARYCSVACQRAAWHKGRHSAVCSIHE